MDLETESNAAQPNNTKDRALVDQVVRRLLGARSRGELLRPSPARASPHARGFFTRSICWLADKVAGCMRWLGKRSVVCAGVAVVANAAPTQSLRVINFASSVNTARAQAVPHVFRITPQLALARVCASEAGLSITPDCAGIHRVIERGAQRQQLSYLSMIRAYSDRVFAENRTDARRWVAHLRPDARQPEGWPENTSWDHYRQAWRDLYQLAGQLVHGESHAVCEPDHWGCRTCGDQLRAQRAGWVEVSCGETANAFWRIPDRVEAAQIRAQTLADRRARYAARHTAHNDRLAQRRARYRTPLSPAQIAR